MTIYVACVTHRHGTDHYAATTREDCLRQVADYCKSWWDDEVIGEDMPTLDDNIVERYFDQTASSESYSVGTCELVNASQSVEVKS